MGLCLPKECGQMLTITEVINDGNVYSFIEAKSSKFWRRLCFAIFSNVIFSPTVRNVRRIILCSR
jgi:hypothetical protein